MLSIISSGILAYIAYIGFEEWYIPENYTVAIIVSILLSSIIFPWFDTPKWNESTTYKLIAAWITVIVIMILLAFILKMSDMFSRGWIIMWTLFGSIILIFMRKIVHYGLGIFSKYGLSRTKIVIVGTQYLAKQLAQNIQASKTYPNIKVIAFFGNEKLQSKILEKIPINHDILALPNFVKDNKIDEVWVTTQGIEISYLETVLKQLRHQLVTVRFVANLLSFRLINASITNRYGLPIITLTESPMLMVTNRFLKYIEDKIIASLILLLITPLMLIIALGIKLTSPGPIFFCQERLSWNEKRFIMFKFRSMPIDIEQKTGPVWNEKYDQRATGFGSFLRKTSLDELPQFWNVLKGDMSIVGPRPERHCFVEKFKTEIPDYMQKHLVKAGITGWAQVNGWRGNTDLNERIEHDIFYIENWSVLFDLQIIIMTIFKVCFDRNAY